MAGIYVDDLTRCLISQTTTNDRTLLARWMVFSYAQHPANAGFVSSDLSKKDAVNATMAELVSRLLLVSCLEQVKKAIRFEGQSSLEQSFKALGEMAAVELMESPTVLETMNGFTTHLDEQKLIELFQ